VRALHGSRRRVICWAATIGPLRVTVAVTPQRQRIGAERFWLGRLQLCQAAGHVARCGLGGRRGPCGLGAVTLEQVGDAAKRLGGPHRLGPSVLLCRLGATRWVRRAVSGTAAATVRLEVPPRGHAPPTAGAARATVAGRASRPTDRPGAGTDPARSRWSARRDRPRRPRPRKGRRHLGMGARPHDQAPKTSCGARSG